MKTAQVIKHADVVALLALLSEEFVGGGAAANIAALGGVWLMTVLGFAGPTTDDDGIGLKPQLPQIPSPIMPIASISMSRVPSINILPSKAGGNHGQLHAGPGGAK